MSTVTDPSILTTCPRDCYDACGIELASARADVNALNPGIAGDMGASTAVHGAEITLAHASET